MSGGGRGGKRQYHVDQVFKAMGDEQLERMRKGFVQRYEEAQSDDFYYAAVIAKREGQETFSTKKLDNLKKTVYEQKVSGEDVKALGAVRLRHTSTSQPLTEDVSELNFSIPFDKNDTVLEQRWNSLLELEDLLRQPSYNEGKVNAIIRHIVHSLQFNTSSSAIDPTNPVSQQRFAHVLNDPKGQRFVARFMDIMPDNFLKRFFFTAFIVFKEVDIDSTSKFATDFLKRLVTYLSGNVKPKWIAAFLRDAVAGGFAHIAASHFKSACVAVLLTKAQSQMDGRVAGDLKLLEKEIRTIAGKIENDLPAVVKTRYNLLFMHAIFTSVMTIVRDTKLPALVCVPAL